MGNIQKTSFVVVAVMMINLFSRGVAMIANAMITAFFGVNSMTGAYSFSLTLAMIITTIIGTALTTAVIPIYIELYHHHGVKRANLFVNNTISLTVIIGSILVLLGLSLAPMIASFIKSDNQGFAIYTIRALMPAVIFISLSYILGGILQSKNKFYYPAMVSLPGSIINIAFMLFLSYRFGMYGLTLATLTGFLMQALILTVGLKGSDYRFSLSFQYKNEDIKNIFKLTAPVLIGVCAYQINVLTSSFIALSYDSEHYVILSNVQNLGIQVVLTIAMAIVSVIYPKLTHFAVNKDFQGFKDQFSSAMKGILVLLLPISAGFFILAHDLVDIVYGYGKFSPADVQFGAPIFAAYAFAIIGIGLKELSDRGFYALKNTKTPAYNGLMIMVINVVLSLLLIRSFGFLGIAFAYSLGSLIGGYNVFYRLTKRIPGYKLKEFFMLLAKLLVCTAVMAAVLILGNVLSNTLNIPDKKIFLIAEVMVKTVISGGIYLSCLLMFKLYNLKELKLLTKSDN